MADDIVDYLRELADALPYNACHGDDDIANDAADIIESLRATIARLEDERDEALMLAEHPDISTLKDLAREVVYRGQQMLEARAEAARLREALTEMLEFCPPSDALDAIDDDEMSGARSVLVRNVRIRDVRRWQAALRPCRQGGVMSEQKWEVKTNAHRNCNGTAWGWIEGAPGNVCWSDEFGSGMSRADAERVVAEHNANLTAPAPSEAQPRDHRTDVCQHGDHQRCNAGPAPVCACPCHYPAPREAQPTPPAGEEDRDMVCEAHPDRLWPHDDCAGPGMPHPVIAELRAEVQRLYPRPPAAEGERAALSARLDEIAREAVAQACIRKHHRVDWKLCDLCRANIAIIRRALDAAREEKCESSAPAPDLAALARETHRAIRWKESEFCEHAERHGRPCDACAIIEAALRKVMEAK